MFLTECSTPEREEEIYKILIFCIDYDLKYEKQIENLGLFNHRDEWFRWLWYLILENIFIVEYNWSRRNDKKG